MASEQPRNGELRQVMRVMRRSVIAIAALSAVINILLLGGSIYMMLVYDSVLPSHSIPTLVGLLVLVIIVYVFQAIFELIRNRLLARVSRAFDVRLAERVQVAIFENARRHPSKGAMALTPMRDLDQVRSFLSGPAPGAFMDLPWIIFFFLILALLHVWLAVTAFVGALVLLALTFATNIATKNAARQLSDYSAIRTNLAEERRRHAETLHVFGMEKRTRLRWMRANMIYLNAQETLSRTTATFSGFSRSFRMLLQSLVLTVGALLVIDGVASGGVIFAGSIISARALAPVDQVIGQWRNFTAFRQSWNRLEKRLDAVPADEGNATVLPRPKDELLVENVVIVPPEATEPVAYNVAFRLKAGDAIGIIGPSGSGKSSLARVLVGAWPPALGSVRLDGASLDQYTPEELSQYIGYVPQTVDLFEGTVAENISRFDNEKDHDAVVAAAKAAAVHELIVSLPKGYETQVGPNGSQLSVGQKQRVALARSLYRDPFIVVLDEPNSNLDALGEMALDRAIVQIRERGGIVIVIAHRAAAINRTNCLLLLQEGHVQEYGTKQDVLAKLGSGQRNKPAGEIDYSDKSDKEGTDK